MFNLTGVMAALVPAIHILLADLPQERRGMPATSVGMTSEKEIQSRRKLL